MWYVVIRRRKGRGYFWAFPCHLMPHKDAKQIRDQLRNSSEKFPAFLRFFGYVDSGLPVRLVK